MFTKEDILARLQNGDSMDEIAKEMSDALNAAGAEYESANAEANRVMEAKRAAVDMILDGICDYLVAAGDEELLEALKDIDSGDVVEALDSIMAFTKSLEALSALEFPLKGSRGKGDCGCSKPDPAKVGFKLGQVAGLTDADAIIKSFLKGI